MKISSFSILIWLVVATLIGWALTPFLPLQWLPNAQSPSIRVQYFWPGAAPEAVEQEVTTPLEASYGLVSGIKKIYSVSNRGQGYIQLELDPKLDLEYLRFDIASRTRQAYPKLPEGVAFPEIFVNDPEQEEKERPLMTWSLSGSAAPAELYRYATETLAPQLSAIAGLQSIETAGGAGVEWRLVYDEAVLQSAGLTPHELLAALNNGYHEQSLGRVMVDSQYLSLRFESPVGDNPGDLLQMPVTNKKGRILRLADLARLETGEQPARNYYRINGQNSIRLLFYPEKSVNTIRLAGAIRIELGKLAAQMPAGYRLYLDDDATRTLRQELDKIGQRTFWSLAILFVFVLLTYRNWRFPVVIAISLAANLGLAFIVYYLLGVELHTYALAGITVSFGMVIDNTIVMAHHLRNRGDLRVFPALLAATLTTMAALVVVFFLPEKWKFSLFEFSRVIMINLAVSLLVAVLLIPVLVDKIIKKPAGSKPRRIHRLRIWVKLYRVYGRFITWLQQHRAWAVAAVVLLFGLPVFWLPAKVDGWPWYNHTIGSEWYQENARPVVNKVLGGTLRLFAYYVYEGGGFREPEETVLHIQASLPQGASLEQMNQVCRQMEAFLSRFPQQIRQYVTQVNSGQYAHIAIYFKNEHQLSFPFLLKSKATAYSLNMGGVKWNIYGVGRAFSNEGGSQAPSFRIAMYGYNKDELQRQAERFASLLLEHPRIQEVNTEANMSWFEKDLHQYEMNLDRKVMAEAKLTMPGLANLIQSFDRSAGNDWQHPNGWPVRLIASNNLDRDMWLWKNQSLSLDSSLVALGRLAALEMNKVSASIHKQNQQYIRMVAYEYTGSYNFGSRYTKECMDAMLREMPMGYRMERQTFQWGEEQKKQYVLILLVMGLIFFICAIVFESFSQAFAILMLIPTSFIGIFLTFYVFDFYFDQGGYTSFVLLSGLVVNSLILIINDYNYYNRSGPGRNRRQNYLRAFRHKIGPVWLTVLSTVLGLIPFLMQGQQEVFWFSLAVGAIGGLLFSVVVMVVFIPVFIR